MTTADLPPLPRKWWENFTEEQHRDPMGTLYDAEQAKFKANDAAKEACQHEKEWQFRVDEIRKLIHQRIGPKP